jgi:hypothetical protein
METKTNYQNHTVSSAKIILEHRTMEHFRRRIARASAWGFSAGFMWPLGFFLFLCNKLSLGVQGGENLLLERGTTMAAGAVVMCLAAFCLSRSLRDTEEPTP